MMVQNDLTATIYSKSSNWTVLQLLTTLWTIKKGTLFILGITWPNVDQTLQYLAEV